MKKLIIMSAIVVTAILNCKAQTNGGFEDWVTVSGVQEPSGWQTLNFLSLLIPPDPVSAFKASGVDKHSGNYALKLKTVFFNNNPIPSEIGDSTGGTFTGKLILAPPSIKLGTPYTGRPEKLEFWAKYIPVGADVAGAYVSLRKWNGISTDTIATGYIELDSTLSYTFFQVDLNYQSAASPDTLTIGFTSSYRKSTTRVGSTLYIDDVALTGWVGIDEYNNYSNKVKIFPNPAKENIAINAQIEAADNMQIVDVSGKLMGVYKIQNYSTNINTGVFAEGIYFYQIRDKKNRILTNGKFNVIK